MSVGSLYVLHKNIKANTVQVLQQLTECVYLGKGVNSQTPVACNFMTPIVSKRHPLKYYLTIGLTILLFIAVGSAIIFDYKNSLDKGQLKPKEIILPILAIACFAFAGYSLYRYMKNAPAITLDKDYIKFNSQTYSTADIDKIELTGKQPFNFVINFPMEAVT